MRLGGEDATAVTLGSIGFKMFLHRAKHDGAHLESQLLPRLRQEDQVNPGGQSLPGQLNEMLSQKTGVPASVQELGWQAGRSWYTLRMWTPSSTMT